MGMKIPHTRPLYFVMAVLFSLGLGTIVLGSLTILGPLRQMVFLPFLLSIPIGVLAVISCVLLLGGFRGGDYFSNIALSCGAAGSLLAALLFMDTAISGCLPNPLGCGSSHLFSAPHADFMTFAGLGTMMVIGAWINFRAATALARLSKRPDWDGKTGEGT